MLNAQSLGHARGQSWKFFIFSWAASESARNKVRSFLCWASDAYGLGMRSGQATKDSVHRSESKQFFLLYVYAL